MFAGEIGRIRRYQESDQTRQVERTLDSHGSFDLPLLQAAYAYSVHAPSVKWVVARIVSFEPDILGLHEMGLGQLELLHA